MALVDFIRVSLSPRRTWILHRRVHHYWAGQALMLAAPFCGDLARPIFMLGLVIAVSDLRDADVWLGDLLASE